MKYIILSTLLVLSAGLEAQVLREINFSYQYSLNKAFGFAIKPIRQGNTWTIFYKLQILDTTKVTIDLFKIQWEIRSSFSDKEGTILNPAKIGQSVLHSDKSGLIGKITVEASQDQSVLVARVQNTPAKELTLFHTSLDPNYPVDGYLQSATGEVIFDSYINTGQVVSLRGYASDQPVIISYYDDNFPTAAPAFSEGQARVSTNIKPDSIFQLALGTDIQFYKKGLYLAQKDTSTTNGFSFRVEDGFPKFKKLEDLVGPFIYVSTKQEFDKLAQAQKDKKQFDRVVISITQNADRAKNFMRSYFRRAELANQYFTSYKEGWKTDRGMIYIIFGAPQDVFKFSDREVWTYGKTSFNFTKSSTLFDPDNYVLIRDKKYTEQWYETVDLVRNGRF